MEVHKKKLIIFTRFPEAGKTKTRLIPHLGAAGAAQLQQAMTEYTVQQAKKSGAQIEIRYTHGSLEQMQTWLGPELDYAEQGGGHLGERMQRAFEDAFSAGWERVALIGADCPSNGWENLQAAFCALEENEVVIGPAADGGYYLIGLCRKGRSIPSTLFENIEWGGEQVFEQTIRAAAGHSVHQLPTLHDVDFPEDIPPRISVIIPTLNEEDYLPNTLEHVREGFNIEIIVVDAGSTDRTRAIVPDALECRDGRAAQQNLGASKATGGLLFFLHADTVLPDRWDGLVRETLRDPAIALGAFTFKVRESFPGQQFIEDTANWRSIFGGLPYGDQGLFLRRDTFEKAGGFPDMPIMEDYAFARRLRHFGKVVTRPEVAITSGRRWQQHGVFKVTLVNKLMILGYHLGVSPEKLAAFYRKH